VNLLEAGSLRWTDNCLVVIDEVHHCLKDHPYRRLIQLCRHSQLDVDRRPRLLGLTASPAGKDTPAATSLMLRQLLDNVAVERLVTVDRHVDDLARYHCTATLDVRHVTYSSSERLLSAELRRYVVQCYLQLSQLCDTASLRRLEALSTVSPDNVDELDMELIHCLTDVVDALEPKDPSCKLVLSFLSSHLKVLCQALDTMDCLGLESAYNELAILLKPDYVANFSRAEDARLPCAGLKCLVSGYLEAENKWTAVRDDDVVESVKKSATYMQLVNELVEWLDSRCEPGVALVLVRRRSTARVLSALLGTCQSLVSRRISVVHVVGHGAGGDDAGMTVHQQQCTLHDIRQGHYNVIVATSVAEEGVDLPDCDVVIQLDAPDCVRALVQVRGRARRPGSRFIAFCHDAEQTAQLNALLLHERHMIDAVSHLIQSQQPA